jgi:hypothetical protein
MSEPRPTGANWHSLLGQQVVVDVRAPYIYIGTLSEVGADTLVLKDADVHYRGDSQTTGELYLLEARREGVRASRARAFVMRSEVVSISSLDDIIVF